MRVYKIVYISYSLAWIGVYVASEGDEGAIAPEKDREGDAGAIAPEKDRAYTCFREG